VKLVFSNLNQSRCNCLLAGATSQDIGFTFGFVILGIGGCVCIGSCIFSVIRYCRKCFKEDNPSQPQGSQDGHHYHARQNGRANNSPNIIIVQPSADGSLGYPSRQAFYRPHCNDQRNVNVIIYPTENEQYSTGHARRYLNNRSPSNSPGFARRTAEITHHLDNSPIIVPAETNTNPKAPPTTNFPPEIPSRSQLQENAPPSYGKSFLYSGNEKEEPPPPPSYKQAVKEDL